jgi:hypothetical protein
MAKSWFWVLGRDDECRLSLSQFSCSNFASVTLVEKEEEEEEEEKKKALRLLQYCFMVSLHCLNCSRLFLK